MAYGPNTRLNLDLPRQTLVYQATNLINGKTYIGITAQKLSERASQHASCTGKHVSIFTRAIRKYGRDMFRFRVIATCPTYRAALETERRLVTALKPDYNLTLGGEGALGYKLTKAQKAARRKRPCPLLGRKRPAEVVERVAAKLRGKKRVMTPELLAMMRANVLKAHAANKAKPQVMTVALIEGRKRAGEKTRKAVVCLQSGEIFASTTMADEHFGLCAGTVSRIATGVGVETKTGLKFVFLDKAYAKPQKTKKAHSRDKAVVCMSLDHKFDSVRSAAEQCGIERHYISKVCRGQLDYVKGLVFRWAA